MKIQALMGVVFAAVAFTGCANNGSNITAESVNTAASRPGAVMSSAQAEQVRRQQVARMNEAETQMAANAGQRDGVDTTLHGITSVTDTAVRVGSSIKYLELLGKL